MFSPPSTLAQSDFAAADAARGIFGDRGTTIFRMFGVLPVGAITSLGVMLTSQVGFATARAGILPTRFARGYAAWNADPRTRPDDNCLSRVLVVGRLPCAVSHFDNAESGSFRAGSARRDRSAAQGAGPAAAFRMPFFAFTGWLVLGFRSTPAGGVRRAGSILVVARTGAGRGPVGRLSAACPRPRNSAREDSCANAAVNTANVR